MTAAEGVNKQALELASRAFKLQNMGLTVDGQPFDLKSYPYLLHMLDTKVARRTVVKGGQIGLTTLFTFDAAQSAIDENLRGILYLFPTDTDVIDFSRARFTPNIAENPVYSALVEKPDNAGLKRIGGVHIYFRAAGAIGSSTKQSLSKLKSIPVDRLYLDERDEMQDSRVDAAERRLDGAREAGIEPLIVSLSTPTIPGYGVHYDYQHSDGGTWQWRCPRCNGWTCLEHEWPNCIAEPVGAAPFYLCSKCHERLDRRHGQRVAERPSLSDTHQGDWISQLCKRSAEDVMETHEILVEQRGRPREFFNQCLGRPFAQVEDQLTKEQLDDCLTEVPRALRAEGPTCAGADPGMYPRIHWYVKQRIGDRDSQTLAYGLCAGFDELAQISRKYNVQVGCVDQMAESHSVRQFVDEHRAWWGVRYVEQRKGAADWDPQAKVVTCCRNEALDASHAKFLEKREQLPMADEQYHELLVPQLCNMARVKKEDELTGDVRYRWVVLGGRKNDHMKHCHGYATLAEDRVSLSKAVRRARSRHYEAPGQEVAVF